jgi:hypothetical protein
VHEQPLRAAAVEGVVGKIQPVDISRPVLDRQLRVCRAPAGLGNHRPAAVHAHHPTRGADQLRHLARRLARAAADIEDPVARPHGEGGVGLPPDLAPVRTSEVEDAHEVSGIGRAIHVHEAVTLSWHA